MPFRAAGNAQRLGPGAGVRPWAITPMKACVRGVKPAFFLPSTVADEASSWLPLLFRLPELQPALPPLPHREVTLG